LTVRYQIQEMLRIERVFEDEGIRDELDAYNPLVPDGSNLKATMLIEYEDVEGRSRIVAIADEDLPRSTDEKTAAVHFLRFELDRETVSALKRGARLGIGVDHPAYLATI